MGLDDKFDAKSDKASGSVKEGVGKLTGDKETEREGQGQNLKGKLKDAGENVKDAASKAKDAVTGDNDRT